MAILTDAGDAVFTLTQRPVIHRRPGGELDLQPETS